MIKKELASVLLAGALLFSCTVPAGAVTVTETPTPDQVFYRENAEQTFDSDESTAIYDAVSITPSMGSVSLTVKNNRTLKPIPGAKYTLFCAGQAVKSGLVSDEQGQITMDSLAPGDYELRQTATAQGYQPASSNITFTVTGLSLSGGDKEIRTSEGKKITAGENEILIASRFSPDIELTAAHEKQLNEITVEYESLGSARTEKTFTYVTLGAAQEEINHLKNEGEISGPVHISYELKAPAGSYTQYLTEEPIVTATATPTSTPAPTPVTSTAPAAVTVSAAPASTPASTATPVATPAPVPSVVPIETSAPTVEPAATPEPEPLVAKRDLTLTVLDTDSLPVPGVTVGIFDPIEVDATTAQDTSSTNFSDISQSISQIQSQKEMEKIKNEPYKKSAAIQISKTDENGHALFQKAPITGLIAVPVSVPSGYSTEKIPTEIPVGLGTDFTVTCPYVAVDLTVHSNATNSLVAGAEVVLCDEDGDELASWLTEEIPHRLIRVPKGEYTLCISVEGQNDKVSFSVNDKKSLQEVQVETYLPGIKADAPTIDLEKWLPLLPYALGGLAVVGGTAASILLFLRKRKRAGGMK